MDHFETETYLARTAPSVFPSFSIGIERAVPRICRCREFSGLGIVVRSWRQSLPPRSEAIPPSSVGIDPAIAAGVRIGCSCSLSYGQAGCAPSLSQPLMRAGPVDAHISRSLFGAFGVDETMKPLAVFHTGGPGGGFGFFAAFDAGEPSLRSRGHGFRCGIDYGRVGGDSLCSGPGHTFGEYGIDLMGISENIDKFTVFFDKFLKNNFEQMGIKNLLFQSFIRMLSATGAKIPLFSHIFFHRRALARIFTHSPA